MSVSYGSLEERIYRTSGGGKFGDGPISRGCATKKFRAERTKNYSPGIWNYVISTIKSKHKLTTVELLPCLILHEPSTVVHRRYHHQPRK
jgi:hypothetical protein